MQERRTNREPPKRSLQSLSLFGLGIALFALCACGRFGGPDPAKVYSEYRKAIQTGDLAAVKKFVAADKIKEMEGEDASAKLKLIAALAPNEVTVVKTDVSGSTATLTLRGKGAMGEGEGTVSLTREGGAWKVTKEEWKMKMDLSGLAGSAPLSVPVEPFMKDPKQPPTAHVLLKGHQGEVSRLAFTPDGRHLVSISYGDYSLRVWNVQDGTEISNVKVQNRPSSLAITSDGQTIVTDDSYENVQLWPLKDGVIGEPRLLMKGSGDEIALSPDNKLIAVTGHQKPVVVYNFKDGSEIKKLPDTEKDRKMAFSPSGKLLVTAGDGNTLKFWDVEKWKAKTCTISKVDKTSSVFGLSFSRDGKLLATAHGDSTITVWDVEKKKEMHNFYVRDAATLDVLFSPDGNLFATAQADKTVYLWNTKSALQLAMLKKHSNTPRCLAFSPDGKTLASGSEDRTIVLWRGGAPPQPPAESSQTTGIKLPELKEPEVTDLFGKKNYLPNPNATLGDKSWKMNGEVAIEERAPGDPCFAIRYSGFFFQDAPVPASAANQCVLMIGRVSSERINANGDITGLPYLYGNLVDSKDDHHFHGYLQGDTMRCAAKNKDEWTPVWGIFKMTNDTSHIRFYLQQASGREAQSGSAARFDDLGVFIFDTETEAGAFVEKFRQLKSPSTESAHPKIDQSIGASTPPAEQPPPKPEFPKIPPEAFKISGVLGQIGTADATVTINGNIFVKVGENFDFEYQGKVYSLKLLSLSDKQVKIQNQEETITVPCSME